MRLIKLNEDTFPDLIEVHKYFNLTLHDEKHIGRFYFPSGCIDKRYLKKGENLLFSYKSIIRYIAKSKSKIYSNDLNDNYYKYYIQLNLDSIKQVGFSVIELQKNLNGHSLRKIKISKRQGWSRIPESTWPFIEKLSGLKYHKK